MLEQLAIGKERAQLRRDDLTSKLIFIPCLMGMAAVIGVFVIAMFLPLTHLIKALTAW
jgi:type II secretory pathway component PulF